LKILEKTYWQLLKKNENHQIGADFEHITPVIPQDNFKNQLQYGLERIPYNRVP
jgi:hypothetical protein